jgi:Zn ribbon nucleic-acid-binding protein
MKCPGQNMQFWKPEDIFEVPCLSCGHGIEFFKDDPLRICVQCGVRNLNPRMDTGCLEHCEFADKCRKERE